MESSRPRDEEHGRRWRRRPFAPARFDRPWDGRGGEGVREPRDPEPRGDGTADAERPPSSG